MKRGWVWDPKVCVPKMARQDFCNGKRTRREGTPNCLVRCGQKTGTGGEWSKKDARRANAPPSLGHLRALLPTPHATRGHNVLCDFLTKSFTKNWYRTSDCLRNQSQKMKIWFQGPNKTQNTAIQAMQDKETCRQDQAMAGTLCQSKCKQHMHRGEDVTESTPKQSPHLSFIVCTYVQRHNALRHKHGNLCPHTYASLLFALCSGLSTNHRHVTVRHPGKKKGSRTLHQQWCPQHSRYIQDPLLQNTCSRGHVDSAGICCMGLKQNQAEDLITENPMTWEIRWSAIQREWVTATQMCTSQQK